MGKEGTCVRPHQGHFSVLFPVISFCGSGVESWSPNFLQFRLALEWACVLLSASVCCSSMVVEGAGCVLSPAPPQAEGAQGVCCLLHLYGGGTKCVLPPVPPWCVGGKVCLGSTVLTPKTPGPHHRHAQTVLRGRWKPWREDRESFHRFSCLRPEAQDLFLLAEKNTRCPL